MSSQWIEAVRNEIDRLLGGSDHPEWEDLELPDDWQSITFRSAVLYEDFDRDTLRAAPFTHHYVAPPQLTGEELLQRAFQRLSSEHSSKESADESIERFREIAPRLHSSFDRDVIEQWYQQSACGETRAQEYVDQFETVLESYAGELMVLCGTESQIERVARFDQGNGAEVEE